MTAWNIANRAAPSRANRPDHTVTSAMQRVGYTDLASFRRLFTAQAGMTPAAYRRQFRAPARRPGRSSA